MASQPRRRALLALTDRLAKEEIGPEATGLDWILDRVASGRTFTDIANELGAAFGPDWGGPGSGTGPWSPSRAFVSLVFNRINPDAGQRIAEARKQGATAMAEQALAIVDAASTTTTATVQKARLQLDARLALAAAFDRATFGTKAPEIQLNLGDLHIEALLRTKTVGQPRPQLEPLHAEILPASDDTNSTPPLALGMGISED